jgi:hypothetical protein
VAGAPPPPVPLITGSKTVGLPLLSKPSNLPAR